MKKMLLLLLLSISYSCEDVVDIDLEESEPRLVVEASLVWNQEMEENPLFIRLTTTGPFFDEQVPPALDASVSVFSENGTEFPFTEVEPGLFRNNTFHSPEPNSVYTLEIIYQDEIYRATEKFLPVPELEYVEQTNDGGFSGDDIELKVFYTDPAGIDNYYFFRFFHEQLSLQIYDDEFTDGNRTFAFFSDEDLESGDLVVFEIQGISERFYEYLYLLRSQSGNAGGPFQTQPTTVKGNVINTTNPDNFSFGYFRLSESNLLHYEIK